MSVFSWVFSSCMARKAMGMALAAMHRITSGLYFATACKWVKDRYSNEN
jgi:hypothetical protein